jgi:beta-N-acetylhexosaminidase
MVAHLHCTCFEKEEIPTSLSKNALSYLYNNLGFNGVTISDDMIMKGVAKFGTTEACEMGIRAGLNMFIYRNSTQQTIEIIEKIAQKAQNDNELKSKIEQSFEKIVNLKKSFNI